MADAGAEVCRDFKRNVCKKGDRCKFYHPAKDLSEIFTRNTVCHDFQNPKGCKRDTCKFLHMTKDEEDYIRTNGRAPPGMSEREVDRLMGLPPLCNDYMRGACNRGSDCKYRHVGEPGTAVGGRGGGGGGKMGGGRGGGDRFDPYSRDFGGPDMGRMEMKRRYREEMMEDEIMYLRAQVSRLKRQVADLAATNESLMDENARLRIDRGRTTVGGPSGGGPLLSTQPRMSELRSAYPYTPGLKMEAPNSSLGGIGGMNFSSGHPY